MGILDRLSRLIRANLNDLSKRAEDPEQIIAQGLEDMRAALRDARMEVAETMAQLAKLKRDQQSYAMQVSGWEEKATEALKAGKEDLAREALKRKAQAQSLADGFSQQVKQQQSIVDQLTTQLKALEGKIQEAESKQALLVARQKGVEAAEAVRRMDSKFDANPAVGPSRRWSSAFRPWRTSTRPSPRWTRTTLTNSSRPSTLTRAWTTT